MSKASEPYAQECGGCGEALGGDEASGWVGCGELYPLCLSCYRTYASMRGWHPDRNPNDTIGLLRVICLYDRLPQHLKPKLCRLLILLRNDSRRARRLVQLADTQELSILQLLEMI